MPDGRSLKFFSESELEERRKDLVDINNILNTLGIRFLLIDGVLLGAIREKNFIKWDWDVELGMYAEEVYKRTPLLLETLHKGGFEIISIDPTVKNLKINVQKRGTKFTLVGYYQDGKWRRRQQCRYPAILFDNIREIEFLGQKYFCPSPPEQYLEYIYGNWKMPKQEVNPDNYVEKRIYAPQPRLLNKITACRYKVKNYSLNIWHKLLPPEREPLFLYMLRQVVKPGVTFIDIGSNDGRESIAALRASKGQIKIFLIEPDAENLFQAKKNIERCQKRHSSKVSYLNSCISDRIGKGTFYKLPNASHLNSVATNRKGQVPIEADFITLDELMRQKNISSPIVIKMDIEGHEVEALRGASTILEAIPEAYILMEVHPFAYTADHSLKDMLKNLFGRGFKVKLLESAGLPIPAKFRKLGLKPMRTASNRGLYADISEDFALNYACCEHIDVVNYPPWFTRKIVRSILLEKKGQ